MYMYIYYIMYRIHTYIYIHIYLYVYIYIHNNIHGVVKTIIIITIINVITYYYGFLSMVVSKQPSQGHGKSTIPLDCPETRRQKVPENSHDSLLGGLVGHPSNMSSSVGMMSKPNISGKKKNGNQTTNQLSILPLCQPYVTIKKIRKDEAENSIPSQSGGSICSMYPQKIKNTICYILVGLYCSIFFRNYKHLYPASMTLQAHATSQDLACSTRRSPGMYPLDRCGCVPPHRKVPWRLWIDPLGLTRRSEYATYPGDWMRLVEIGQCIYAVDLHSAHFGETRDHFLQKTHVPHFIDETVGPLEHHLIFASFFAPHKKHLVSGF